QPSDADKQEKPHAPTGGRRYQFRSFSLSAQRTRRAVAVTVDRGEKDAVMEIRRGGLDDLRVRELLGTHLRTARAATAPGSAHALDLGQLQEPGVDFWTIWEGDDLLGMGALKQLTPSHYEIKSMHTALALRRRGIGSAMLYHLMAVARDRGASRL